MRKNMFDITEQDMYDIEQKSEHIWRLIKSANKAGVKPFIILPYYKSN